MIRLNNMANDWYVLHVKPHKERPVNELLQSKDIDTFYPALKVEPVNPRARKERPLFPGYIFVNIDVEEEGPNTLRWTEGTHGLVAFDGEPAIVPENVIQAIKQRLAEIQAQGGIQASMLKKGDHVRIVEGPLAGYEAIFDMRLPGKDRVQVLLAFLSTQPKRLQINQSQLIKVPDKPS